VTPVEQQVLQHNTNGVHGNGVHGNDVHGNGVHSAT
jgi:hypothetical protein